MVGSKQRQFAPLIHISLEDLVPADHFYRHLEQSLDLSLSATCPPKAEYACRARPAV
jgi:hypothetical protein